MTNTQPTVTTTATTTQPTDLRLFLDALWQMIDQGLITLPRVGLDVCQIGYSDGHHAYLFPSATVAAVSNYLQRSGRYRYLNVMLLERDLADAGVITVVRYLRGVPMPDVVRRSGDRRVWSLRGGI